MCKKALYQLLTEKPYPMHQIMDVESIDWLKDNLKVKSVNIKSVLPNYEKFPLADVDFNAGYFTENNGRGIHGIRHQFRVSLYVWILIQMFQIPMEHNDIAPLLQVCLYHDIMRENDNSDENHGDNSAKWIADKYPKIDKRFIDAVKFHNQEVDWQNKTTYIKILKEADALDRFRLPKTKWWIRQELLDYKISDENLMIFKYITYCTEKVAYNCTTADEMKGKMLIWLEEKQII